MPVNPWVDCVGVMLPVPFGHPWMTSLAFSLNSGGGHPFSIPFASVSLLSAPSSPRRDGLEPATLFT